METLIPAPGGVKKPQFSRLLRGGKRRIDLGGTSPKLTNTLMNVRKIFVMDRLVIQKLGATKYMNMNYPMKL